MNSEFVISLRRIRGRKACFPDGLDILFQTLSDLQKSFINYQLKKPKALKNFALNTFNEIVIEERYIHGFWENSELEEQMIIKGKGTKLNDDDFKRVVFLNEEKNYYGEILNLVEDAKVTLIEFLAGYHPEDFAKDEKKFQIVEGLLPVWNVVRQRVTLLRKVKISKGTASVPEYVMSLFLKNITLNKQAIGSDGINYSEKFGRSPNSLYNALNTISKDKVLQNKLRPKVSELIKNEDL